MTDDEIEAERQIALAQPRMACQACATSGDVLAYGRFDFRCPACCARWLLRTFPAPKEQRQIRKDMLRWLCQSYAMAPEPIIAELTAQWQPHLDLCRRIMAEGIAERAKTRDTGADDTRLNVMRG